MVQQNLCHDRAPGEHTFEVRKTRRRAYVTVLTTESYLDGVLVLNYSLKQTHSIYPLVALTSMELPDSVSRRLDASGIEVYPVPPIPNPNPRQDFQPYWNTTYTKLRIFGLPEFEKIVYVDADMLVCTSLDELFSEPHFSAINSGGQLPKLRNWVDLNSGLMVIEPDPKLLDEMLAQVGRLPVKDHSDQSFLHSYFPDWPQRDDLHLDHRYNMFSKHLDQYSSLFGYRVIDRFPPSDSELKDPKTVSVIHYIGPEKPWHSTFRWHRMSWRPFLRIAKRPLLGRAARLWHQARQQMLSEGTMSMRTAGSGKSEESAWPFLER